MSPRGGLVGFGILGAGMISTRGVGPAITAAERAAVVAVGARDRERAGRLAAELGPSASAYGSYAEVVADPAVEVVYVALANDAHLPWILASLRAGKHVVCEKPLALDAVEVATAFDAADAAGLLLVEASWYRWHPRTRAAAALVAGGGLGAVTAVDAGFTFDAAFAAPGGPANYRNDPALGGGALYDVGCYALSAASWAAGGPGNATVDHVEVRRGDEGADVMTDAAVTLEVGGRRVAIRIRAAFDEPERQWLDVTGDTASLHFSAPAFTAWQPRHRSEPADVPSFEVVGADGLSEEQVFAAVDPYELMVDAVAGRVRGGGDWVVPRADSEAVAALIDAIRAVHGARSST